MHSCVKRFDHIHSRPMRTIRIRDLLRLQNSSHFRAYQKSLVIRRVCAVERWKIVSSLRPKRLAWAKQSVNFSTKHKWTSIECCCDGYMTVTLAGYHLAIHLIRYYLPPTHKFIMRTNFFAHFSGGCEYTADPRFAWFMFVINANLSEGQKMIYH